MNIHKLSYFSDSTNGLAEIDFNNDIKTVYINLDFMLFYTEPQEYRLSYSKRKCGVYSIVQMNNNYKFYIKEDAFDELVIKINSQY